MGGKHPFPAELYFRVGEPLHLSPVRYTGFENDNMGVIYLGWRVVFFLDEQGRNVISHWLDGCEAGNADRIGLQSLLDILAYSGPESLSYCTEDLEDGFFALKSRRRGGLELAPIFTIGPFSDKEITFLAGARIESKRLKPRYAKGIAEENLEALLKDPWRKRRERLI
jgi:hypothetical protein